jgi:hypothetical protein
MRSSILRSILVAGLACLATPSSAATVFVRFVDAEFQMPLEFWQHTAEQPTVGHPMHFRMPTAVLVDDKVIPFAKHEKAAKEPGTNDEDDGLVQELGIAFARPIAVNGLGVWEHPYDRPVSAFALEMKIEGAAAANADPSGEKGERWQLVLVGKGNLDYYHQHRLAEPVTAKTWRYTVLDTPSAVQRIAEIEIYSSSLDSLLDGGELGE